MMRGPLPTGTYSIAASGYGFLSSPIASVTNGDSIYGLVSSNPGNPGSVPEAVATVTPVPPRIAAS